MRTGIDELVVGNFLLSKEEQPPPPTEESLQQGPAEGRNGPSTREVRVHGGKVLRRFAFTLAGFLGLFFGLFLPVLRGMPHPDWPFAAGFVLLAFGTLAPGTLLRLYRGWVAAGAVLGRVYAWIILGIIFFGNLTPVAMFFRAIGRDPTARRRVPGSMSYRLPGGSLRNDRMEVPF